MENQTTINASDISSINQALDNRPSLPSQTKTNFVLPILLTVLVSASIFGFGGYYLGQRSNLNLSDNLISKKQLSIVTPTVPSETPATSTQPDDLSINTISEVNTKILINFDICSPTIRRVSVAFGSTTIEIQGKEGDFCKLNYGGEVENPNWDGKLLNKCEVPTSLKLITFTKSNYGVDLSQIQQYCTD